LLSFCLYFQMVTRTKKIFVGGLSAPTTLEDVKSYFEQFGTVSKVVFSFGQWFICGPRPAKVWEGKSVRFYDAQRSVISNEI
jgi:RNA recognition motif-containing protein